MNKFESIRVHLLDEYYKLCQDLVDEVSSFDITSFYESEDAKELIVITPNQIIVIPVYFHDISISKLYHYLYSIHCDYRDINNIVIRLDSSNEKLFLPTFPKKINTFQSKAFSYYFNQLENVSKKIKCSVSKSIFEKTFDDIKDIFNRIPIDDSFIPVDENIISLTSDDWHKKHKVAWHFYFYTTIRLFFLKEFRCNTKGWWKTLKVIDTLKDEKSNNFKYLM